MNTKFYTSSLIVWMLVIGLYSCSSNKKYYYQDISKATKENMIFQENYYKEAKGSFLRNNNQILLVFNGEAFADSKVTINNKDTLLFKKSNSTKCLGMKLYVIDKSNKKVKLMSTKKKSIVIPVKKEYNYVEINGSFNNKWAITYSEFFPLIKCE
ncbi:hypothetical protein REB14_17865 [Chryseobacterium sp. ES2]|uniref:Lipoprotein n=1 Tax=Chryseobacterium metallicongregator TaxID=3073042 RepID=A0ABU1E8D6_9FLAO|nr:hypothetical protein [Chryseobacterium sp. ES2]MDR4954048.1 hypothetical protein [Chryseobacterium sp. ES2]